MTMVLHGFPMSPNTRRALLALEEVSAEYRLEPVDLMTGAQKSEAYRKLNPTGRVPTLVDGEMVLWESNAILVYLAEKFPDRLFGGKSAVERAEVAFRQALDERPDTRSGLHLGRVLQLQGRAPEALAQYDQVLRSSAARDERWLAHLWRGRIQEEAGNLDNALGSYRLAAEIAQGQTTVIAIAHLLYLAGDQSGAEAELRRLDGGELACADACDPYQSYDLVDRAEIAEMVRSLVSRVCGDVE